MTIKRSQPETKTSKPTSAITAKDTLAIYLHHMRRYPRSLTTVLTILPTVILIQGGLLPLVNSRIIDRLNSGAVLSDFRDLLPIFISLYFGVFIGQRIVNAASSNLEFRVIRDLEQRIFSWLMLQSHDFHTNNYGGALVAQAKRFTGAYSNLYTALYINVFSLLFRFVVAITLLAFYAPLISILLLVWTVIYLTVIIHLTHKKAHMSQAAASADTNTTARLSDAVGNAMVVRMFGHENIEQHAYSSISQDKYLKRKRDWRYSELITATQSLLMIGLEAMVLCYSIILVQNGAFTIGELALVQFFLGPILLGLWDIGRIVRGIETGLSDAQEMTTILLTQTEVKDPIDPEPVEIHHGGIRFEDINFSYKHTGNSQLLFENFNFHIKPGEKIGVVGLSGSGKSTLSKLLLRFMDVDSGRITIDGQDITRIRQNELRNNIAFVPQEPLLFHRSIMENIRYGNTDASDQAVIAAAKKARADDFISKLPEGYDTPVGERGTKLSGGERQRIAIARAILKEVPIVILDEATSALDSKSEKKIQQSFNTLMKNRTALVIAHRLSTIQHMDRIIVMDSGKIIEQGTHRELISQNGTYASLWAHQVNS